MLTDELTKIVGQEHCLTDESDMLLYGYDHSGLQAKADIVVMPKTTEEVAQIVKLANKYRTPIITRGSATNTCGATVPIHGGIILSTQKLNHILEIQANDKYAVVQPGVINEQLQNHLSTVHLFWPPDPGSSKICTIGGNIACNSAGPSAVKYGVTRDHLLGLTFVTGYGDIIKTGVYTSKGVVGYDFTRLLTGSEGTLGIITEAVLKLSPIPKLTHTLSAHFDSINSATSFITSLLHKDLQPSALELLDENCLNLIKINNTLNIPANSKALLIVEVNGNGDEVNQASQSLLNLSKCHKGCIQQQLATVLEQRKLLWQARKALSPKLKFIAPKKINEDIVVPISALPEFISYTNILSKEYNIPIVNFGHAGNGNIHVNILIDPNDLKQSSAAEQCLNKIFAKTLSLRGTLSGEHGIGLVKAKYTKLELSDNLLALTKSVKLALDPNNILNPQLFDHM